MKLPGPWFPDRRWGLYILSRCLFTNFAGSGYKHLRYSNGLRHYFWTRKQAQRHADKLNGQDAGDES